jgi:hypothetical protein
MKIPKKIKIGGHMVKIVFRAKVNDDNDCGEADFEKNLIVIDEKMTQTMKEETLIHEILHWLNSDFHGDSPWSHSLLEALAQGIYQVLKDNKLF